MLPYLSREVALSAVLLVRPGVWLTKLAGTALFYVLHFTLDLAEIHQWLTAESGRNGAGKRQTGRQADKKYELIIMISFRKETKCVWIVSLTFEILQMKI